MSAAVRPRTEIRLMQPADLKSVAAVEVYYGPATVPGEFQSNGGLHACGAIVIWTKRGR